MIYAAALFSVVYVAVESRTARRLFAVAGAGLFAFYLNTLAVAAWYCYFYQGW